MDQSVALYYGCNGVDYSAIRKHYTYHDTLQQSSTQSKQNVANPFIVFNICTLLPHMIYFKMHGLSTTTTTTVISHFNVSMPFAFSASLIKDSLALVPLNFMTTEKPMVSVGFITEIIE
jgi:hypothetical protein